MIFANKNTRNITDLDIFISNTKIERSKEERFLGIIMDCNLTWAPHRQKILSKLNRNIGTLRKLKGIVPIKVLKLLYSSFIQSNLYYCPTIWGLGPKCTLEKIFTAQKKAVRLLSTNFINYKYDSETGKTAGHTKSIFNENEILTVHNIVYTQTLILLNKVYNTIAPKTVCNIFEINLDPYHSRHRTVKDLILFIQPKTTKTAMDNTIVIKGIKIYNKTATNFNRALTTENICEPLFENKFTKPFKNTVKRIALKQQILQKQFIWHAENFPLYTTI